MCLFSFAQWGGVRVCCVAPVHLTLRSSCSYAGHVWLGPVVLGQRLQRGMELGATEVGFRLTGGLVCPPREAAEPLSLP